MRAQVEIVFREVNCATIFGDEFIEAMDGTTPLGNQCVDGDVEDTGCLAQAQLRSVEGLFKRNYERRRVTGKEKRRAEPSARLKICLARSAEAFLCVLSYQTLHPWKPPVNLPSGC